MEIGFVGLGKMGLNMAERLRAAGHAVLGTDVSEAVRAEATAEGIKTFDSVASLAGGFSQSPRVIWLMVPAGKITESCAHQAADALQPGDIVVDGGNSFFKDSQRLHAELAEKNIHFVDCGTSGGVWGKEKGYCMMLGGDADAVEALAPLLDALAPPNGWERVGPSGAGHYVKMVHNGIEYGLLEAYAEGFEMLASAQGEFGLELPQITKLWNQGSVIRSWLLELAERAYDADPEMDDLRGVIQDNGTGRWTVEESIARGVPTPVLSLALQMRFRSRQEDAYAARVVASLRNQFGGHAVTKSE
jgi:6-phosphogluconate dehydrogenase